MASSYFKPPFIRVFNSNLISTFVSVGLHGVALFLLVPYLTNLPTSEPETTDKGPITVPLIELNPGEQSRLPEQNAGVSGIPEFPNSSLGDLPMFGSPSLQSSLPNNFSNLPTPPSLPPLPALPALPSYNNYNRIPIELPPRRSFPPSSLSTRLPSPTSPSLQTPTNNATPEVPPEGNSPERPDFEPLKPPVPIDELINQGKGDRSNDPNQVANNPQRSPDLNNDINRRDEIARNLQQEFLQEVDNLIYNPQGTKREEARDRDLEWMQQTGVTLKHPQMMTLKATYPKAACSRKLEGSAIYNVLVNDNGQPRKPPFMTQSSGYGIFNNLGLQAVNSRSFPQSTRVQVIFQYDPQICGTGVVEGERNTPPYTAPENSNNPKPTPQPESQPETAPENSNNPKPTPQPESQPKSPPSNAPENSNNPKPTPQPSHSPSEDKNNPNPLPDTKSEGVPAPHRDRK